ncbi:MerR family DNA-binding protein [Nonomuraea sp. NPDC049714]|uniref:MerR family DNA-binding protein n=1 Tax=Nonomuraea sp. NPDC049714 TaxID=3364357 RepID=UPI003797F035
MRSATVGPDARDHHPADRDRSRAAARDFTLDEVAELIDTGRRGHPTSDLRARAQAKIAEVEATIADLTTIRSARTAVI